MAVDFCHRGVALIAPISAVGKPALAAPSSASEEFVGHRPAGDRLSAEGMGGKRSSAATDQECGEE